MTTAKEVLTEADRALERGLLYGPFSEMLEEIAEVWTVILKRPVTGHEVALCMIGLKIVRAVQSPQYLDSWIDLAGYAAGGAESAQARPPIPEAVKPENKLSVEELESLLKVECYGLPYKEVARLILERL
jgi:hypothetical protein